MQEYNIVLNTKGESFATVHHGSKGDVGKRKIDTALTYTPCIEMLSGDEELSTGITLAYLFEYTTTVGCKTVILC